MPSVCHLYHAANHKLCFSKFIPSIHYVINSHTMNQLNADIKYQINNVINALPEDLYLTIAVAAWNFDVPTQILQRRENKMSL